MSDSKIQKLLSKNKNPSPISPAYSVTNADMPIMLKIRLDNDDMHSFGYNSLVRILQTGTEHITLFYSTHLGVITITGHNLVPLYDALSQHKVEWIREQKEVVSKDSDTTLITEIKLRTYEDL